MVDRIRYPTVSYLPFYYVFLEIDFQFLLLTIFNLQAKILAIKDILSNLAFVEAGALLLRVKMLGAFNYRPLLHAPKVALTFHNTPICYG